MGISILLIEDNKGDIRLIQTMLNSDVYLDFDIDYIGSINEALQYLEFKSVDLILLDLSLPDGDGLDTYIRISKNHQTIPVVVLTDHNDSELALQAVSIGAQDYLIKGSFDSNYLQKAVLHSIERHRLRIKLERSESRFKRMIEQNADGILIFDDENKIAYANPSAEKIFDRNVNELIGENSDYLLLSKKSGEIEIVGMDGRPIYIEMRTSETNWDEKKATLVSLRDVTSRIIAEQNSRLSAKVFESTAEGIMVTNLNLKIIQINSAFTNITGFSYEEALGKTPSFLKSGKHDENFYKEIWEVLLKKGSWTGEIWNRRKNGMIYPQSTSINTIKDENGKVLNYVAVFSDISHRKQVEEQLRFLASHDSLTELPNRSVFSDRLKHALERGKRNAEKIAVMFLDLNKFKAINDDFGHAVGDKVLQTIGRRLSDCMRKSDTVSRLGGDEFTILLENVNGYTDCETVARKINNAINHPIVIGKSTFSVSASIGISIFPDHSQTIDGLMKQADYAMYQAKKSGRDFQFFEIIEK